MTQANITISMLPSEESKDAEIWPLVPAREIMAQQAANAPEWMRSLVSEMGGLSEASLAGRRMPMATVQQLASANNWQFSICEAPPPTPGKKARLLTYFDKAPSWAIVSGSYEGMQFKSYISQQSGDSDSFQYDSVMEISLKRRYPHIFLDSQENENKLVSSFSYIIEADQQIELEANYSRNFILYAPNGYQVDALSLIDPATMQSLLQLQHRFDVEIYDQALRLRTTAPLYTQEVFQEALNAAALLFAHFQRTDKFWRPSSPQDAPPRLRISSAYGDVLKIGNFRIFAFWPFALIIVGVTVAMFVLAPANDDVTTLRDDIPLLSVFFGGFIGFIVLAFVLRRK